jgi:hypothetical protein
MLRADEPDFENSADSTRYRYVQSDLNNYTILTESLKELNRSIHLYGERNARLGSLQSRTPFRVEGSRHPLAPLTKILLFGLADKYLSRLNNLWVDKVIYTRTWRPFAKEVWAKMTGTMIQVSERNIIEYMMAYRILRHSAPHCKLLVSPE